MNGRPRKPMIFDPRWDIILLEARAELARFDEVRLRLGHGCHVEIDGRAAS
jgi:hypothetical protein